MTKFLEGAYTVFAIITVVLVVVLCVTLAWDALAWLTGNEDSWRNTRFRGAIYTFAALLLIQIPMAIINSAHGWSFKRYSLSRSGKSHLPPKDPAERNKWANRLPPYDG